MARSKLRQDLIKEIVSKIKSKNDTFVAIQCITTSQLKALLYYLNTRKEKVA